MEWILKRVLYQENRTLGNLFVNGQFFCYTLEDKVRPDGVKVWGETAIPAGRYSVAITFSNRFKRPMIQVLNVPNFAGIRIHPGVSEKNTHGCILVSHSRQGYMLVLEKTACSRLEQTLARSASTTKTTLLIVDDPALIPVSLPAHTESNVPLVAPASPPTWADLPPVVRTPTIAEPISVPPSPPRKTNSIVNEIRIALAAAAAYIGGIDRRYIFFGVLVLLAFAGAFYYYKTQQEKR